MPTLLVPLISPNIFFYIFENIYYTYFEFLFWMIHQYCSNNAGCSICRFSFKMFVFCKGFMTYLFFFSNDCFPEDNSHFVRQCLSAKRNEILLHTTHFCSRLSFLSSPYPNSQRQTDRQTHPNNPAALSIQDFFVDFRLVSGVHQLPYHLWFIFSSGFRKGSQQPMLFYPILWANQK